MDLVMVTAFMVAARHTAFEVARAAVDKELGRLYRQCHFPSDGYHNERCYITNYMGGECEHQLVAEGIEDAFENDWHVYDSHVGYRDSALNPGQQDAHVSTFRWGARSDEDIPF